MDNKFKVQILLEFILALSGLGAQTMPHVDTWTPSLIIWGVALILAMATLVWWLRSPKDNVGKAGDALTSSSSVVLTDYTNEWEHFDRIKEAMLKVSSASTEQAKNLSDIIQRERVYLDDAILQEQLEKFVSLLDGIASLKIPTYGLQPMIPKVISEISKRMNKRYKR